MCGEQSMKHQPKKLFSIALALAIGGVVVLLAWKGDLLTSSKITADADGDSWLSSLLVIPQASTTSVLGSRSSADSITTSAEMSTTTTSILARDILVNYAVMQKGSMGTTWNDEEADALAKSIVSGIEVPKTEYTLKDLNISSDNSDVALGTYGTKILSVLKASSPKSESGEVAVFMSAVSSNDPKKLSELAPFIAEYSAAKKSLLTTKTPSGIAPIHLLLVQNFANTESALISMQKMFTDPVGGLAGFIQYKKEVDSLVSIANAYKNYKPAGQ